MNIKKLVLFSGLAIATIPLVLHSCKKDSTDSTTTTTTATTSTTATTATTGTTTGSGSFVYNNITSAALDGSCNFGQMELTITGFLVTPTYQYTLTMLFPDSAPAPGTYTAVFAGVGTDALNHNNCRANLEVLNLTNNVPQLLKAADGEQFTLTSTGPNKYAVSFGSNKFTIVSGSTATRYCSATSFGCK